MSPPVVRGRQLVKQRLFGLLFIAVLAGLIGLTIAQYNKAFADRIEVTLEADRIGNQLSEGADVKLRGLIIGEVTDVESRGDGATLTLALDADEAARLPSDLSATLVPKTLFGEKFVSLSVEDPTSPPLDDGDVIPQDRSETAMEFATALDDLTPLLRTLRPEQLSLTLNAVSSALRGRGEDIGENLVLARDYLREFNPELPTLAEDFRGLADFSDTLTASSDDILSLLEDLAVVNQNLVESEAELDAFLRDSIDASRVLEDFLVDNETRLITLARESVPVLQTYARYSPEFPCVLQAVAEAENYIENSFGILQPGLHITLEFVESNGPYVPGDQPEYLENAGPTCRGLINKEIPFPVYRDGMDGYRDGQEVDPDTGTSLGEPPNEPCGDSREQTYRDSANECTPPPGSRQGPEADYPDPEEEGATFGRAMPQIDYDRAAVGAAVSPILGRPPAEVPDIALMLFGPLARGTVVHVGA